MRNLRRGIGIATLAITAGLLFVPHGLSRLSAQTKKGAAKQVPLFQVDPAWPKIPNNWLMGEVSSVAVDSGNHIWVLQRPRTLRPTDVARVAPAVLEFDVDGTFIKGWGGPGQGYEWPTTEHGIFVDAKDNVWLAGSGEKDDQVLKFTTQGKFLAQFGREGKSGGSSDTQNLGGPANLTVDSVNNELYVGDGYRNRRVIVIDTETLAFKRMWGASGNTPDDKDLGPYNPD